ncbi:MAG: LysE family translocator [Anaerolineae bacterium]|nr:LysE family translocator [Anaerolineae bacterium]
MLFYLLQGLTLGFTAGVSPGPLQAYFLSQTIKVGWKSTLPAAFAPLLSDAPIIFLVLAVLTQTPDWFRRGLQIVGGGFILYLAWGAYQTFRNPSLEEDGKSAVGNQSLREATIMNLLNPHPYIFWGSILGPILIESWRESPPNGMGFILGFYASMIVVFMGFIVMFGTAAHLGPSVTRILSGVSALALLIFGAFQIYTGVIG